jgi:monofunctional biosynthetic peptidoglycan transglycosylase
MELPSLKTASWTVIDDGVMGGRSSGQVTWHGGRLVFHGQLSLENNGGFSSIRTSLDGSLDGIRAIRLTVRGDRRTYQMRLRQGQQFDGVAWRHEFPTSPEWQTLDLPLKDFRPGFRGRDVPEAGAVDAGAVCQIGFLVGDKIAGAFRLEIAAIEALPQGNP